MTKLVELIDVAIEYDDRIVCEGVSFTIEQGEKIAIQGKNGSAESSILKLIMERTSPI